LFRYPWRCSVRCADRPSIVRKDLIPTKPAAIPHRQLIRTPIRVPADSGAPFQWRTRWTRREKNGTATRVKGSRPGIADTWTPAAASDAPADEAPPADAGQPAPVPVDGTAEDQQAEAGTEPGPDSAVTAEAAGNVLAIAQAADAAGRALAAGGLDAALAALDTARGQAACGRR
jgi:hypothetical protein